MTQSDIMAVASWPTPTCSKDVERFMGLANYHRNFVKNFSKLAEPLYSVVGKHKFKWKEEQMEAFGALKEALTNPPVLALPNQHDSFVLDTDASNEAIGAELIQVQNGQEKVIAYGSYALTKEQRRYCTTRKELLAIVRFCRQYRYYLLGKLFTIRTDHSSLRWLLNFKEPQGQLARWMEELSQYNMSLKYRAGSKHQNADSLSRNLAHEQLECDQYTPGMKPANLPCGGCKYCVRADSQWGTFTREVDDAVPLTMLNPGARGVVHDVRVPDSESNEHGGLEHFSFRDATLGVKTHLCASAETVTVRKNNQIRQSGKTEYREEGACNV
ncbi:MAG: Ty3/Gypsy family RNase HI domain-containing protein, partial [Candidatus Thiodiazotropha taylori]|nr:Ty3/Gypsy family RNase HI domain-containing protein [Candidatus Thiodiazotropha taylori]MCW4310706.1 Ty3/Gypsy family RNase HI domain-containing protein [Candidatus Thiodiazotropha endolucinida]